MKFIWLQNIRKDNLPELITQVLSFILQELVPLLPAPFAGALSHEKAECHIEGHYGIETALERKFEDLQVRIGAESFYGICHPVVVDELTEISSCTMTDCLWDIEFIGKYHIHHIIDCQICIKIRSVLFKISKIFFSLQPPMNNW